MAVLKTFSAQSSQHAAIRYTVAIHDAESVRQPGAQDVGVIINCESAVIATVLGWTTPDGNLAVPDLNPSDLGIINMENLRQ